MLVYALAANGSQTGEGYIQGQVQQVPAQSQNRGPGNSTGDGLKNSDLIKEKKMRLASRFGLTHSIRQERPLTNDELVKVVPSVFSEEKHNSRSDRYTYIPTITLLDKLREEGFQPFFACQSRVRDEDKRGHTKHMVRLRREGANKGTEVPEIILLNSHDGSSSYQMIPGMFRFVCTNGLVCGTSFGEIRVPHKGDIVGRVIEGAYEVLGIFDKITEGVDVMKSIALTKEEQRLFGQAALTYRYEDENKSPVSIEQIIHPRRYEDKKDDIWTTYQRVQENLIKGGLPGRTEKGKRTTTRPVKAIDGDVKLNKALWLIAEKFRTLKG
ncbi:hypothetical protein KPN_pKPN4p07121 (plasmid) [Klebsiella pneumoniae subsp. pneumoniae MGH 78578]|uniref:DUF945 domain-containing protein n=8 Tax=Klebsiella TaxID=570 RepID=A6TIS7_KLEP7|nr:hypothetical protein KPN_pKPN4p07121 [Klebsiella pneumoniae subsp. pneumoniae MGH 78578]QUW40531.1 UPF0380 protein YafZ-like protein [Raoultella ornithinolytica]URZ91968.1 hypothetical protein [Klebsiella pneumoniae]